MSRAALQLYTVRDELAQDFAGTLRTVSEMGYGAVEFAGYGGLEAPALNALLYETDLKVAGAHVQLEALEENMGKAIDYCRAIDCPFLVVAGLPKDRRDVNDLAPFFNELGSRCQEAGLQFAYHNHEWEFLAATGTQFMEEILAASDPALVYLELDVYWAAYAGVDPIQFWAEQSDRIRLIHLKDMAPDGSVADVGAGRLQLNLVVEVARDSAVEWLIVENDEPKPSGVESARRSLANLKAWIEGTQ